MHQCFRWICKAASMISHLQTLHHPTHLLWPVDRSVRSQHQGAEREPQPSHRCAPKMSYIWRGSHGVGEEPFPHAIRFHFCWFADKHESRFIIYLCTKAQCPGERLRIAESFCVLIGVEYFRKCLRLCNIKVFVSYWWLCWNFVVSVVNLCKPSNFGWWPEMCAGRGLDG